MKLRTAILSAVIEHINGEGMNQCETAELLGISQPRVSALMKGKISEFRLDNLVNVAHKLGLHVSMKIAA